MGSNCAIAVAGCLFVAVCTFPAQRADAQSLSKSKLSAHFIDSYTVGSSSIVFGRPRVLKVLALDGGWPEGMVAAMRDYRLKAPAGKIVVRVYSPRQYSLAEDATAAAADFWANILAKSLNYLSPSDRALIDYLEGPNEGQTPTLGYPSSDALKASQWFNQFWTNLTPRIVAAGFKPCIGSLAVGNPGGDMQAHLSTFVPALRQARDAGGAWSYHSYTIQYTTDVGVEYWYSLRYRQFYQFFAASYPDLSAMPLILTEGGVDQSGDPAGSGWRARGSASDYQRWLNWFDQQISLDAYVLGCTLFQNGDPGGWWSFDLEPISTWLRDYLLPPLSVPPVPSGFSAVAGLSSISLSWTNAPLNPTTYTVRRATSGSGPFLVVASNVATGVQAGNWPDISAAPNTDYYYVVSAVNAFGESPWSMPVSARITNVLPDVIVTSVSWTPAVLSNGTRVVFSANVLNRGTAPTPAGTILGVGFNVDGLGTASWSGSYTVSVPANQGVALTADGGPANNYWTATPGAHVVVATVDDVNRFAELDEGNNAMAVSFVVPTPAPVITGCFLSNSIAYVTWRTVPGVNYVLQSSENLDSGASWVGGAPQAASSTNMTAGAAVRAARQFFRILQLQ